MTNKEKKKLLRHFSKLTTSEINILANKRWENVPEFDDYESRQGIYASAEIIDRDSSSDYDDTYGENSDNYTLLLLDGKYYIDHGNYMTGGGTDHWGYCFDKD